MNNQLIRLDNCYLSSFISKDETDLIREQIALAKKTLI